MKFPNFAPQVPETIVQRKQQNNWSAKWSLPARKSAKQKQRRTCSSPLEIKTTNTKSQWSTSPPSLLFPFSSLSSFLLLAKQGGSGNTGLGLEGEAVLHGRGDATVPGWCYSRRGRRCSSRAARVWWPASSPCLLVGSQPTHGSWATMAGSPYLIMSWWPISLPKIMNFD